MADYRNRPPVDAPAPTVGDALRAGGIGECIRIAFTATVICGAGYVAGIAGGLVFPWG